MRFLAFGIVVALGATLLAGCGQKDVPDEKLLKPGEYLAPPKSKGKGGTQQ